MACERQRLTQGELRPALALAQQMLEIARGAGSVWFLPSAHQAVGATLDYLGDFPGRAASLPTLYGCLLVKAPAAEFQLKMLYGIFTMGG